MTIRLRTAFLLATLATFATTALALADGVWD